ncbi:MAG: hypothetical protein RJA52_53 [Bacteroidota bacterium]
MEYPTQDVLGRTDTIESHIWNKINKRFAANPPLRKVNFAYLQDTKRKYARKTTKKIRS